MVVDLPVLELGPRHDAAPRRCSSDGAKSPTLQGSDHQIEGVHAFLERSRSSLTNSRTLSGVTGTRRRRRFQWRSHGGAGNAARWEGHPGPGARPLYSLGNACGPRLTQLSWGSSPCREGSGHGELPGAIRGEELSPAQQPWGEGRPSHRYNLGERGKAIGNPPPRTQ
jgi:hypothetical protein